MSQLETIITQAWHRQAKWLWLLWPLSALYGLISALRRMLYRINMLPSYQAPIPVMVIGNITVGGSGKTPLIIALVTYLQEHNIKVGVVSRGHGGDSKAMPCLVTSNSLPQVVGDEPCLIVDQTQVPMSVCGNRKRAIEWLLAAYPDLALIVSDDGLQHYALKRDIEWIVVDVERGFGNEQLLPVGFLREPISRLSNKTVIYHYAATENVVKSFKHTPLFAVQAQEALTMRLIPKKFIPLTLETIHQPLAAHLFCQHYPKVYAVSGIGYPPRFFKTLGALGLEVIEKPYKDHHRFSANDLSQLTAYPIVVTSKDAVKLRLLINQAPCIAALPIWVLPVDAALSETCYQMLDIQLEQLQIHIQ